MLAKLSLKRYEKHKPHFEINNWEQQPEDNCFTNWLDSSLQFTEIYKIGPVLPFNQPVHKNDSVLSANQQVYNNNPILPANQQACKNNSALSANQQVVLSANQLVYKNNPILLADQQVQNNPVLPINHQVIMHSLIQPAIQVSQSYKPVISTCQSQIYYHDPSLLLRQIKTHGMSEKCAPVHGYSSMWLPIPSINCGIADQQFSANNRHKNNALTDDKGRATLQVINEVKRRENNGDVTTDTEVEMAIATISPANSRAYFARQIMTTVLILFVGLACASGVILTVIIYSVQHLHDNYYSHENNEMFAARSQAVTMTTG